MQGCAARCCRRRLLHRSATCSLRLVHTPTISPSIQRCQHTSASRPASLPPLPIGAAASTLLKELKYLEEDALRAKFEQYDLNGDGVIDTQEAAALLRTLFAGSEHEVQTAAGCVIRRLGDGEGKVTWHDFKAAADAAATPVDSRVRPIYATLILTFVAQGIQFPVLPQLARSLSLTTTDLGLISASTSAARILCNVPAAMLVERVGRRPLLIAGPAISAVGMCVLADSNTFVHMIAANVAIGSGMACTVAANFGNDMPVQPPLPRPLP